MKQSNSRNSAFQLTASQGGWPHLAGWPLSVPYFNSQPHKEADKDVIVPSRPIWYFNSQPHKEADQQHSIRCRVLDHFNSQPHKEADWWPGKRVMWWRWFQLTASQGGWLLLMFEQHSMLSFQLTASQGGWHGWRDDLSVLCIISTHSLTRRLTQFSPASFFHLTISTHSLTRRLTGYRSRLTRYISISTHSLTRRLTIRTKKHRKRIIFQLTASQGGWRKRC